MIVFWSKRKIPHLSSTKPITISYLRKPYLCFIFHFVHHGRCFLKLQSKRQAFMDSRQSRSDGTLQVFLSESESRSVVSNSLPPHGLYNPWNSPGQNTRVGSLSLLQGIFPTQGSNPGPPHCRWILYQLSHKGSPKMLEWLAFSLLQQIFPS